MAPWLASLLLSFLLSLDAPGPAVALQRTRGVRVKELTDETFEHDTQAASGQTTGRWLVVFVGSELDQWQPEMPGEDDASKAEEDSGAKSGQPLSSADVIHGMMLAASELTPREFIPAIVHVDQCPALKKRFKISATPTLKLFRDRKMYSLPGPLLSAKDLRHFLELGYSGVIAEDVPPEPTFLEVLLEKLPGKYQAFRERLQERPWLLPVVCFSLFVLFYSFTAKLLGLGKRKTQAKARGSGRPRRVDKGD